MTKGPGMRPVVLQMGVTLDGFVHGAKGYEDWGLPPEDDEVVAWKAASLREAGTHIMGHRHPRLPAERGEPMKTGMPGWCAQEVQAAAGTGSVASACAALAAR